MTALCVAVLVAGLSAASKAPADTIPPDSPIREALEKAEASVATLVAASPRNFANTIEAFDDLLVQLENDTSMTQFLAYVSTDAEERARGQRAEEEYTNWMIGLFKREDLYKAVKSFADSKPNLQGDQKLMLADLMREFRRAGMELPADQREEVKRIQMQITRLGLEFDAAIRDDETRVPLSESELTGVPKEILDAQPRIGELLLVGMDYPTYMPIQELCSNEATRAKTWIAYKRRGGERNVRKLEEMLKLRARAAALLGYSNPAEYEIEPRMAKTPAAVEKFYNELRPKLRTKAEKDLAEFLAAKRAHVKDPNAKFYPWDYSFYESHLKKTKYAVDSEIVKEYFPMQAVIDGLFSITQSLYGLEYRDITAQASSRGMPLWHEDVKLYEVMDKQSGQPLGMFYLDLYPRPNKYNHAAQWGLRQHKLWSNGEEQKPLAALVCNFPKPTADKPSLMPHGEVATFFHEFGHCLHTILSTARYGTQAGTNVSRDFVEAPSQMFENWVWSADVLKTFAKHYKSGAVIPDDLVAAMVKARNLGSGMYWEHQIYYGSVDLAYHTAKDGVVDTTKVANELFPQIELYETVPNVFFQASFGHLNGYQAGYYGYMWSLVYAQDMFQRFNEKGMLNPEAGQYYREKILARGSSLEEIDLVREYLGREPKADAFLKHLGLE